MDAPNKIKFVDDDGSVEVVEPPMTSRVHKESFETIEPQQETIEEESSSEEVKSSSGEEKHLTDKEPDLRGVTESMVKEPLTEQVIEDAVEQHVKDLEKMESVITSSFEPSSGDIISDIKNSVESNEVKDEIDKEALSLVANAVNDVRAEEQVIPKGCCILQ